MKQSKVCLSCAYISVFHPVFKLCPPYSVSESCLFCCLESCSISIQKSLITGPVAAVSILLQQEDPLELRGRMCSFLILPTSF